MPWITRLGRYAMIPKWVIEKKLSGCALRLYAWLIVAHAEWTTGETDDPSIHQLASELDVAPSTVIAALATLEREKLMSRVSRAGRATVYVLENAEAECSENRTAPNRKSGRVVTGKSVGYPTENPNASLITTEDHIQTRDGASADADSPSFSDFWSIWPHEHRVGRKQAEEVWKKLAAKDRGDAYSELQWRVAHDARYQRPSMDGKWSIPHPFRWLRDRRFEDARPKILVTKQSMRAENVDRLAREDFYIVDGTERAT